MITRCAFLAGLLSLAIWAGSAVAADIPLVDHGDGWMYRKGTNAPQSNWKTAPDASLDATWLGPAPGGFGYGDSDDATTLSDMQNRYTTVYIRRTFSVATAGDTNLHLFLRMNWDDGFVAWLDGVELKRSNANNTAAGTEPPYNDVANPVDHEAGTSVEFDLGAVGTRLAAGNHVLALLGLNDTAGSSDLSLIADLYLAEPATPPLVSHSSTWRYRKGTSAPPSNWRTVADNQLDGTWLSGPGGFGFSDSDDATVLSDMRNGYKTVYTRITFPVTNAYAPNLHAILTMDYDDAFVAWLDGAEIARAPQAPGSVGTEPLYSDVATANHEASRGDSSPQPAVSYDLGAAASVLPVGTHILAVMGLNVSIDSSDFSLIADLDVAVPPPPPPGTITVDTNWTAAASPYVLTGNLTVASPATLTIEPGVTVLFGSGASMIINGRLLAEGTAEAPITFTRSGTSGTWGNVQFSANSVTSRLARVNLSYFSGAAAFVATGTTLFLDSISWSNATAPVVDLHNSSITLLNSHIPGGSGSEPIHFSGMPANGHALIKGCVFAAPQGYSDSIDFTGGNRPGPIPQFMDNLFLGAVDDCFDMDGTDAHIEGNIFLNVRKDAARSSSSHPIATGADGGHLSELVVCRNIIYNCEHAFLSKDYGTGLLQNNTIVRLTDNPLSTNTGEDPGIILFGEPWRGYPYGGGVYLEGNIAYDLQIADPFPLQAAAQASVAGFFLVRNYNCITGFDQPGTGNLNADPLFVAPTGITASNILEKLALQPGSPCIGTGPNGLDMGALVPAGASIAGAPTGTTTNTTAVLTIAGPGIWSYRWRLNGSDWSPEVSLVPPSIWNGQPFTATMLSVAPPITLSNLVDGTYTLEVIGRNSAGVWQDTHAAAAVSWKVQTQPELRILAATLNGQSMEVTFEAQAGKSYSLLRADALSGQNWAEVDRLDPQPASGVQTMLDPNASLSRTRFYRLVTPAR